MAECYLTNQCQSLLQDTGSTDVSLNITGATVGQTVKISEVDENGVPTAWVPVEESQVQADYAQNDPNAKDHIKNRPFYGKKGIRIRNTYEDWAAAGGDDGSGSKPILSFIINDEIYENITPYVYNGGYTKVYNIPSHEQPKYQVIAYTQNRRIICTLGGSSKEIENWSIYPPEETEEIHYLDSKYLDPGLLARIEKLENGGDVAGVSSINGQTGAVTITAEGLGALTEDDLQSATDKVLALAKASGEFDGAQGPKGDTGAQGPKGDTGATGPQGPAGAGLDVTGATVGQTVKISAVDANGVPTAWVPVDVVSGEKWEKIAEIVIPDGAAETNALTINKDINGDQFRLIKARLCVKQPKYTGDSSIPSFSFAMINGKTSGRIRPLAYTSAFRMPSKNVITGSVYEVDVSGAQQIETVYRSGNVGWNDDSGSDFVTYSNTRDEYARYVADTLWAKPITSIGGTGMLIYPGCRYVLYGVRA